VIHLPAPARRVLEIFLPLARKLLSARTKRYLKRFWDPNQNLSRPEIRQSSWRKRVRHRSAVRPATSFDIVCFPVFDWEFRFQRPQQLMVELGRRGHRVFFLSPQRGSARRGLAIDRVADNVWQVVLPHTTALDRYGCWSELNSTQLLDGVGRLRRDQSMACVVAVVQLPTWTSVATTASRQFGWTLVYDCMDDWESFRGVQSRIAEDEKQLVNAATAITVSSEALREKWSAAAAPVSLVRNAVDFERFAAGRSSGLLSRTTRPVIGYYGAIAEWFDVELIRDLARQRPQYSFVLIGNPHAAEAKTLRDLPNVHLLGEKPYELMPAYLADFDVCIIPFRITPLTRATDPVKIYEYFSQGKPVVATPLPELQRHQPLLVLAADSVSFAAALDEAVRENDPPRREARIEVAKANPWSARGEVLDAVCREASPLVSVIVVTYNNVEYTRLCIDSVLRNTHAPRFEVIVVDNASTDGTRDYLEGLGSAVRVLFNERNEGFARANNQGIAGSQGSLVILLNNDTVVPPGWSCRLLRHLAVPEIGAVVSVTNFSGNESRIDVSYADLDAMEHFAARQAVTRDGESFDIPVGAMYCFGMRRSTYERIGPLDERFTVGMFEDDDYSHRIRQAGLRVVCAEDAFVHHFGQASFGKLPQREYFALFDRNKKLFEEKWGRPWIPHKDRAVGSKR